MNLRKLIAEEVRKGLTCDHDPNALRRDIPYDKEAKMMVDNDIRNTPIPKGSAFHFGNKGITAKEMGLYGRVPEFLPVDNTPAARQRPTTERQKDYDRFMEDKKFGAEGPLERSKVYDAPRADGAVCSKVLESFNVNAIFEDLNGNLVAKISLESKQSIIDKAKHEEYIPGGLASRKSMKDIAAKHGIPIERLMKQLKKGIKVEMEHTTEEMIAVEIAKDHLMEDPAYYDKLETIEEPKLENRMGVTAYEKYWASPNALRMQRVLEDVNKLFGTAYFVETAYPKQFEEVFVIKSGKVTAEGKPVGNTKLVDFQKAQEDQGRVTSAVAAMNGMRSPLDDGTPWREMTEPLPHDPYRSAIAGSSARNG